VEGKKGREDREGHTFLHQSPIRKGKKETVGDAVGKNTVSITNSCGKKKKKEKGK